MKNDMLKTVIAVLIMASGSLAGAQTLKTLANFNGANGNGSYAALTLGNDGNFYGTSSSGGSSGVGTVFQVTTNGVLTTLVSFNNTNGANPYAGLTLGNDGNLYGTTANGGDTNAQYPNGMGTVFQVKTNGTLSTLIYFNYTDGANPRGVLMLGNDGNLYGTTVNGDNNPGPCVGDCHKYGTVFEITTNGSWGTVVYLPSTNASPVAGLALGNDGNFYGISSGGGASNKGTFFQVTPSGTLKTLASFIGTNGSNPQSALTIGNNGSFFGTTGNGGTTGAGTVFRATTNGALTTLVSFTGSNGSIPHSPLTLGNDGNFYGTTYFGGSYGFGTVFQVTTNGALTTIFSFNSTNGAYPQSALTVGNDGNFYGTTSQGGIGGGGTVFCLLLTPLVIVQPQNQTQITGGTATFVVIASNLLSGSLTYQWQRNGTNLIDGGNIFGSATNSLTITSVSDNDTAIYSVIINNSKGNVTNYATLTVIEPPIIVAQPTNQLTLPGTNISFGVSLSRSAQFHYQWQFNGTNLPNATNATYVISAVTTNKAGNYSVVVTNAAGIVVSSNAALTVVLSPKSQTNYASSTATFSATAFGPESLNYQWQKNGTNLMDGGNISGSTNRTLTLANVQDADAAIYNVVVSDAANGVTSSNATLTVNDLLFIVTQPLSQAVAVGNNATFTAKTYGAPPFIFQWYYSNSPVGSPTFGTNVSSYTLTNVQINQSGNYKVQVINGLGSLMSSNAVLTVFLRPTLNLKFLANYPVLNLNGMLSNNFVVQYNTNLAGTNWITLLSLTNLQTSPYQFLDPAGVVPPVRFYRVWMQ